MYGKTKLHGEEGIENNLDEYYIFRTAWLYGIGGNNFVKTMTKLGLTKDELNVVADQHGSPTYAKDLAQIIYQAIDKKFLMEFIMQQIMAIQHGMILQKKF